MAGIVSVLMDKIKENLTSEALQRFGLVWGFKTELEKLKSMVSMIQAVLQDVEEVQPKSEAVKNWLLKLKDAACDADDVLDEIATEDLRRRLAEQENLTFTGKVFSLKNKVAFSVKMASEVKEILERLDIIVAEMSKFHLLEGGGRKRKHLDIEERQPTHSFVIESEVYGREQDKEMIVDLLINKGNEEDVSTIPIFGMGGLGKTTLAQLVYNDEQVKLHFKPRMWVHVSDDFSPIRLVKEMMESVTKDKCENSSMDLLQDMLRRTLAEQRFLLVLDDVWNENDEQWESLKQLLRSGARGSKILVTTRSEKIASIMGTLPAHRLGSLSVDDCWSLFKHRAFGHGQDEKHPNLVVLGKEIVEKCGGLPLAAKTLGSSMRFKKEEREWLAVRDSEIWNLSVDGILHALRLSYNHLPPHLKQCFLYCTIFPKGHVIYKEKLIRLWMAMGFIKPSEGREFMEDIGRAYFHELLWRSFFQSIDKDDEGNIISCKMHDLVHDLARSIAGSECLVIKNGRTESIREQTRHLSMVYGRSDPSTNPEALNKAKHLRTFCLLAIDRFEVSIDSFLSLRYLRALDLGGFLSTSTSLEAIGELKHLRYLNLSGTVGHSSLPESINSLCNLQTLDLSSAWSLNELTKDMGNLINLRHLDITDCCNLNRMPTRIGQLRWLQTLPRFIVGKEDGCKIQELQDLNLLQGELYIDNLQNVEVVAQAKEANIKEKRNLRELGLSWKDDGDRNEEVNVECVIEALQPHSGLRRLYIENYMGSKLPNWMINSLLPNLVKIELLECRNCERFPPLGQLRFLEALTIDGMDVITSIGVEFYGGHMAGSFPALKELKIKDVPNLVEWWEGNGTEFFPRLERLAVTECPKLKNLPLVSSLQHLKIRDVSPTLCWSIRKLTSLVSLKVYQSPHKFFPERLLLNHNCLKSLKIRSCSELESLSFHCCNLISLKHLSLSNCDKLVSFSVEFQDLPSLESLNFAGCRSLILLGGLHKLTTLESLEFSECTGLMLLPSLRKLTSLRCLKLTCCSIMSLEGIRSLISLQVLALHSCYHLKSLSSRLLYLSSLKSLTIYKCPRLVSLAKDLQKLTSLEELKIEDCPSLELLPESVTHLSRLQKLVIGECGSLKSLPHGLQVLKALQELEIYACPDLQRLFDKNSGIDRHMIQHVREVSISEHSPVADLMESLSVRFEEMGFFGCPFTK